MDMDEIFTGNLMMHTERYFNQLGIPFVEKYEGTSDTKLNEGYTVKLNVYGDLKGRFVLNMETSLAYSLVSHYILEAVNDAEIPSYADKVIAEIANIVAGKTISEEEDIDLYLGCPAVYLYSEARSETELDVRLMRSALTEAGVFQCVFIKE
ncbi:hypothetical protein EHS13_03720 [Paenibacillus psychroresistens]|uniref:Chemotaxis phosphatase CheX-like domain-containing protein n=1 Tax=Paenibacillus psychroresistens TaxID=1778678 RepID=A0A6B8REU2_9BACL|nr:chemotaxis protein CheX [Paenibacillus psychroresistens]QGQ94075.1 hypothetical protein EHS13_03720 [Paenibacillus psychroresistens]